MVIWQCGGWCGWWCGVERGVMAQVNRCDNPCVWGKGTRLRPPSQCVLCMGTRLRPPLLVCTMYGNQTSLRVHGVWEPVFTTVCTGYGNQTSFPVLAMYGMRTRLNPPVCELHSQCMLCMGYETVYKRTSPPPPPPPPPSVCAGWESNTAPCIGVGTRLHPPVHAVDFTPLSH